METESPDHQSRALSEEILLGMKEWRRQHPKATLREIEEEVSKQMSRLGVQVIQETAQSSPVTDWTSEPRGEAPRCPQCGTALGTAGEQRWKWSGVMGRARAVASGFFPPL